MKKLESILVVLDKPKHRQLALERALWLQKVTGAHLHLVSFCWLAMAEQKDVFDTHQRRSMRQAVIHERQRWLRKEIEDDGLRAADVTIETVYTGDIASWVAERAAAGHKKGDVDLVVKTVHQSATLTHTPLDWDLLKSCPAPLLLVSTKRKRPSGNVLATIDLKHDDRRHRALNLRVLDAAGKFVELYGGKMHCVSAVEFSEVLRDLDLVDVRKLQRTARDSTKELLDAMLEPYNIPRTRRHMPAGKVGQSVADVAAKINASLLVVGTSSRRSLGESLLGASAEKILARANCDVLAMHP